MGRLKTNSERMIRVKKVLKKRDFGRCFEAVEGSGWKHYTKGFRRRSVTQKILESGSMKLFSFLDKINPKEPVTE